MKKVIVITNGEDLRAFRLNCHRGDSGLEFDTEEIEVTFYRSKKHSPALLEHAVFGKRESPVEAVGHSGDGNSGERPEVTAQPDDREVQSIARRISELVRRECPDLWNLVAPPELATEIRDVLETDVRDQLTCVRMEDLLEITAEQVEEHFHPIGSHAGSASE